jgi:hypothetical protein
MENVEEFPCLPSSSKNSQPYASVWHHKPTRIMMPSTQLGKRTVFNTQHVIEDNEVIDVEYDESDFPRL